MAAQPTSIVRLNDYCVVEYSQELVTISPNPTFYKLYNKTFGLHHIFNGNNATTGNLLDYSVTMIDNNQYLYLNQETTVPYWDRYPDVFMYNVPGSYDTFNLVRFHFSSGFDFTALPGVILGVKNKTNSGSYAIFANIIVTPELYTDLVKNNTSPVYLADAMFDKYVDIYVPAAEVINQDYYNQAPESRSSEFGALITYNGTNYTGLIQNSPIVVTIDECSKIEYRSIEGEIYDVYTTDNHFESIVATDSLHQKFGAYIGESTQFDAIEFYGTMTDSNGNLSFVGNLINLLSTNAHDSWVIAHQLTIHEWIDGVKTATGKYIMLQESNFDEPIYYRPILKGSGSSLAFEIDYTCRLHNRRTGDQLIRIGSYMSYNSAKYGKSLSVLPMSAQPSSHVIYNKIVKTNLDTTDMFVEQRYVGRNINIPGSTVSTASSATTTFIPMIFDVNRISVSQKDLLPDFDDMGDTIIYKQGDLRFILTPFDNMLKFKVHTVNNRGLLVPMEISNFGTFNFVMFNNNKKIKFKYINTSGMSNPRIGELVFKIPQTEAELLITSNTREFYITMTSSDNVETVLYSGFWNDATERDIVTANIERVKANQASLTTSAVSVSSTPSFSDVNLEISIPGYTSKGLRENDASTVLLIPPTGYNVDTDSGQIKANAALSSILKGQANHIAYSDNPTNVTTP